MSSFFVEGWKFFLDNSEIDSYNKYNNKIFGSGVLRLNRKAGKAGAVPPL